MAREILIDGLQLLFRGTGLATVTSELLRGLASLASPPALRVLLPAGVAPAEYELTKQGIDFEEVPAPRIGPDYLFRACWGRRVTARVRAMGAADGLFIPYLFNYGHLSRNVVLLPDLVNRLAPDASGRGRGWWNLRRHLPLRRMARQFEEWKVKRARRLVVYSSFVRRHAAEVLRIPEEKFAEIRLAPPRWITQPTAAAALPDEMQAKLPARFMLYVGGYAEHKNVPALLRVCAGLHRRAPDFRCVFAGLSEQRIAADRELSQAWQSAEVRAASILLPRVENAELGALYRRSQLTVYPSLSEGFGLPLVEAAACGRLCLCGDNSSMVEIQPNPRFRVDASDERAWIERVEYFWRQPEECAAAGRECKAAAAGYSWARAAEQVRELFGA